MNTRALNWYRSFIVVSELDQLLLKLYQILYEEMQIATDIPHFGNCEWRTPVWFHSIVIYCSLKTHWTWKNNGLCTWNNPDFKNRNSISLCDDNNSSWIEFINIRNAVCFNVAAIDAFGRWICDRVEVFSKMSLLLLCHSIPFLHNWKEKKGVIMVFYRIICGFKYTCSGV